MDLRSPRTEPADVHISQTNARAHLPALQLIRAAAAVLVVLWHLGGVAGNFPELELRVPPFLRFGYAGVDIFFVLSGFIICYLTSRAFNPADFMYRRFVRIYPFYAFFTSVMLAAWLYNPRFTMGMDQPTVESVVKSFLVLPQRELPLLFPGWSLEHEVLFYALVAATLIRGRHVHILVALIILGTVGLLNVMFLAPPFWDYHVFSVVQFEFAIGVVVFLFRGELARLGVACPLTAGFIALGFTAAAMHWPGHTVGGFEDPLRIFGFGLAGGAFLICALNSRLAPYLDSGRLGARVVASLVLLGDASYVLYLTHPFVISAFGKIAIAFGIARPAAVAAWLILALVISCLAAAVFHVVIERPLLRALTRAHFAGTKSARATAGRS
jgi:exopolysaccharide production protein ExoZ